MNKIKDNIIYLGLDYKKEIIKIVVVNLLIIISFIPLFIFVRSLILLGVFLFLIAITNYVLISSFSMRKQKLTAIHDEEFICLITYFQLFISNGDNVYTAFKKCIDYSSFWMKEQIISFLEEIDNDKSVQPFLNFAHKFTKSYVESTLIAIYQMVDEGEKREQLMHFNHEFEQISNMNALDKFDKKKKSLDIVVIFPLIGAGAVTIMLTLGIISIIGEMVNVF